MLPQIRRCLPNCQKMFFWHSGINQQVSDLAQDTSFMNLDLQFRMLHINIPYCRAPANVPTSSLEDNIIPTTIPNEENRPKEPRVFLHLKSTADKRKRPKHKVFDATIEDKLGSKYDTKRKINPLSIEVMPNFSYSTKLFYTVSKLHSISKLFTKYIGKSNNNINNSHIISRYIYSQLLVT